MTTTFASPPHQGMKHIEQSSAIAVQTISRMKHNEKSTTFIGFGIRIARGFDPLMRRRRATNKAGQKTCTPFADEPVVSVKKSGASGADRGLEETAVAGTTPDAGYN